MPLTKLQSFVCEKRRSGRDTSPVSAQVDAGNAKVVARSDESWGQPEGTSVRVHSLLAATAIG